MENFRYPVGKYFWIGYACCDGEELFLRCCHLCEHKIGEWGSHSKGHLHHDYVEC